MDKPQKHQESALSVQQTSEQVLSICPALSRLNMIRPFPLSDEEIVDWAGTIKRIDPSVTKEEMSDVIDGFITGRYSFSKELGIRNIFEALKLLRNNDLPEAYFYIP